MRGGIAVVVCVAVMMAGCMVGPKYQKPQVAMPENHRGVEGTAKAESLADAPWWEVFQDEVLRGLVREAIEKNYDLKIAAARVEEAAAAARIARGALYPEVYASGSLERERLPGFADRTSGSLTLPISWQLDLWGQLRKARDAGRYDFLATEEGRKAVLITLVAQVAQSYFALRELDLELEISKRTVKSQSETLELFKRRREGGVASGLDVAQAEANLAATAADIPAIERLIAQQENAISLLLGRNPGPIARGAVLTAQVLPPEVPAGLPSALLERRPDVRGAEASLQAANARVGVARANYFPQISLTGLFGVATQQLRGIAGGSGAQFSIGAGLLAPVYAGGQIRGTYQAALARWEQAKVEYEKTVQSSFRDVADALVAYEKLQGVRVEQGRLVEALRKSVELSTIRYKGGLSNYLDVLIAERNLYGAEQALAQTRGNQLNALVGIYLALGGGWEK